MKLNWNFLGGGGVQNKKPSVGGVWIFSGTAHSCSENIMIKEITDSDFMQVLYTIQCSCDG